MIALVFEVTKASIKFGSMLKVSKQGSTKTGVAPTYDTAKAVAIYVLEGIITSSPSLIDNAFNERSRASNPFPHPGQE